MVQQAAAIAGMNRRVGRYRRGFSVIGLPAIR
jgi:hypothetical protein